MNAAIDGAIQADERTGCMRKTKDVKRKKKLAAIEYKKGNRAEAYKMWAEAKQELHELRGRPKQAGEAAAETAEAAPSSS